MIVRNFPIRIAASDVIVRGLRIRNGDGPAEVICAMKPQIGNANGKTVSNIIVDHCSFGWSVDETVEFWYGANDVTMSYTIISEALWKSIHGKAATAMRCSSATVRTTGSRCTTICSHNERRNPWIKDNARVELVNNVIYNWGTEATGLWNTEPDKKPSFANIIGNVYKGGADCERRIAAPRRPWTSGVLPRRAAGSSSTTTWAPAVWTRCRTTGTSSLRRPGPCALPGGRADRRFGFRACAAGGHECLCGQAGLPPARGRATPPINGRSRTARSGTGRHIDKLEQIGGYPAYAKASLRRTATTTVCPTLGSAHTVSILAMRRTP